MIDGIKNTERDYTLCLHKGYSRIDVFCVLKRDASKVIDCYVEPITISAHGPVVMSIHLVNEKQPKL